MKCGRSRFTHYATRLPHKSKLVLCVIGITSHSFPVNAWTRNASLTATAVASMTFWHGEVFKIIIIWHRVCVIAADKLKALKIIKIHCGRWRQLGNGDGNNHDDGERQHTASAACTQAQSLIKSWQIVAMLVPIAHTSTTQVRSVEILEHMSDCRTNAIQ